MPRTPDLRFDPLAPLYAGARPGYPRALWELLLAERGGRAFGRAVDLGCGAGHSLAGLFDIAREVIGVEPADAMRAEAARAQPAARLVRAGAAATGLASGSAELVTIATAFRWMDASAVLAECARLLAGGGLLAIYEYGFPRVEGAAERVLAEHMERHWNAHRSPRLLAPDRVREHIEEESELSWLSQHRVPNPQRFPLGRLLDFLRSTSYVSAFLATLGEDGARRYLEALSAELGAATSPDYPHFDLHFDLDLHLARRAARRETGATS